MYPHETLKAIDTRITKLLIFALIVIINFIFLINSFAVPIDTVTVIAKTPEAESRSVYQINFDISQVISPKAIIRITFPEQFDLSKLLVVGSNTINGGFSIN